MPTNYYEVLGVDRDATYAAIRRAYRRLALELHPDRSDAPDAEERFKQINDAYDVLKDAGKRFEHDRWIEWQEQEEKRQQQAETRRRREEAERRREEQRRQQAEARRRQREEEERRQRQAEERKQREERVRRTEEERRRRQAEDRLRQEAERQRHETTEPQDEPDTTEHRPAVESSPVWVPRTPRPARRRRLASTTVVVSFGAFAFAMLLTGVLGTIYLFQSTTSTSEQSVQPTPDLEATIAAAVAAALPTAVPTQPPATTVPSEPVIQQIADLKVTASTETIAVTHAPNPTQARTAVTAAPTITPTLAPTLTPTATPTLATVAAPSPEPPPVFVAHPPDQPRDFRKIHGTGNILYLKWKEPQYDGGTPIDYYEIVINGPGLEFNVTTSARGFPHPDMRTVPEFAPGVTYDVSLTACNNAHCSEPVTLLVNADPIVPTPTPSNLSDPPGSVRNIRIVGSTSDSTELVWEPPASSGGSPIEEYLVMLESRYETRTEWVIAPYVQFSELAYDNQYVVRIMAANSLKDGPFATFMFSTHLNGPITTP